MAQFLDISRSDEFQRTLDLMDMLGDDLQEKGVKSAMRYSAKPVTAAMKAAAPDDPRTAGSRLAESINVTVAKTGTGLLTGAGTRRVQLKGQEWGLIIGPNKKVRRWSMNGLVAISEWGAKPHIMKPRANKKGGGFFINRNHVNRPSIMHPGVRGTGWMGRSFDLAEPLMESKFYEGLSKWLVRLQRKQAKAAAKNGR